MKCKFLFLTALSLGLLSTQVAAATPNVSAHVGSYNLILKGDYSNQSDTEGTVFIGGNIDQPGTAIPFGNSLPADNSIDAVTVVGNINAGNVQASSGTNIVYGGNLLGTTNLMVSDGGSITQKSQATLQTEFDNIWSQVQSDSAYFAGLSATPGAGYDFSDWNQAKFKTSTATDLTVYNILGSDLTGNTLTLNFETVPTVPVVINVDASSNKNITVKANMGFDADTIGPMILWNFYNAENITFDTGWVGSILAPNAHLYSSAAPLEGGVAALSFSGNTEFHNNLYSYVPPKEPPTEQVPAPAGVLLIGLGLLVMARRKFTK